MAIEKWGLLLEIDRILAASYLMQDNAFFCNWNCWSSHEDKGKFVFLNIIKLYYSDVQM